jgi:hypothetical protein
MNTPLPAKLCRAAIWGFAILYVAALALYFIGTFGLFGSESGPLAGIFLIPLGVPWHLLVELAPEPAWPWLAAAAPLVNLLILWLICRRWHAGGHGR